MPPRIICLGEGMIEERVAPDGAQSRHHGGDTLNIAIHLARLGCDVRFASAVGSGPEDEALAAAWQAEGVDPGLILRHRNRSIGRYRIAVDAAGERSFSYDRANSAARDMFDLADDGWRDAVLAADVLVFSLISLAILPEEQRAVLLDYAGRIKRRGGMVAFDGNYRPLLWESPEAPRHWHRRAVEACTIGLPTCDDEVALHGAASADEVAARWTQAGCGEVIVKDGASGCRLPDGAMVAPPSQLAPVDTSGAGDAFDAGYLAARLGGLAPADAAMRGHALAGWTIMRSGAIPPRDAEAPYG